MTETNPICVLRRSFGTKQFNCFLQLIGVSQPSTDFSTSNVDHLKEKIIIIMTS